MEHHVFVECVYHPYTSSIDKLILEKLQGECFFKSKCTLKMDLNREYGHVHLNNYLK